MSVHKNIVLPSVFIYYQTTVKQEQGNAAQIEIYGREQNITYLTIHHHHIDF